MKHVYVALFDGNIYAVASSRKGLLESYIAEMQDSVPNDPDFTREKLTKQFEDGVANGEFEIQRLQWRE